MLNDQATFFVHYSRKRQLESALRRAAKRHGIQNPVAYGDAPRVGTLAEELAINDLILSVPIELRRGLAREALYMARNLIANAKDQEIMEGHRVQN